MARTGGVRHDAFDDGTRAKADAEADVEPKRDTRSGGRADPFDAFAEMAAIPVRPCFRPPCSAGQARTGHVADGKSAPSENRSPCR